MSTQPQQKRNFRRTQGAQSKPKKDLGKNGEQGWKRTFSQGREGGDTASELDEEDICIICAEKIKYASISPCNHVTCNRCTFRQRALYNKRSCLVCRTESDLVIFSADKKAAFGDINSQSLVDTNDKYGVSFTSKDAASATLNLLLFTCPFGDTGSTDYENFKKYNAHLKNDHNKTICMICASHKKAFPSELRVYTPNQLRVHQSKGDSEGFKGHPMCGFCSGQRFYSDDELNIHMRDRHERCHICDQENSASPRYFKDYDQLFEHFKFEHYICTVQSCLDSKFVVFRDDLDLQAHILKEHGSILRNGNNNAALKGRKYQSQLSTFSRPSSRNSSTSDFGGVSSKKEDPENSQEVKRLRMEERARHYLNYSHTDFEQFLAINESYKNKMITAQDVYSAYENLFKSPQANTALLLYDFSELFPKNTKFHQDLRAIYDSEQKKQDRFTNFPSLSNSSPSLLAGNVVSGSWGRNGGTNKAARQFNFPALKKPSSPQSLLVPQKVSYSKPKSATPKVAPSLTTRKSSSTESFYKPTYLDNKKASVAPSAAVDREKFPPLPKSQAKKFRAPLVNQPDIPDPSQWGKTPPSSRQNSETSNRDTTDTASPIHVKKGKQKQLLFHIGI